MNGTIRIWRSIGRCSGYIGRCEFFAGLAAFFLAGVAVGVPETMAQSLPLPQIIQQQQTQQVALVEKIIQPTVCVHSADGNGGGSGVLISADGFALTNYHVVQPCGRYMQCTLSDGQIYDAVIVGIDPTGDVALIQLLGRDDFPVAQWGDSDRAVVGETCYAVGNPFLLATNRQPTVTRGIISGTHRYQEPAGSLLEYTDCLQIDASVNPGNSGGPLFNHAGQLIGINGRCSFEKRGRINVGVAYAISINQIKLFLATLQSGRVVDHATLGAAFAAQQDSVVALDQLLEESDAAELGLEVGDQLLEFGGVKIANVNQFKNRLGIFPNRWYVPIKVQRGNQVLEKRIRLTRLHTTEELQQTALPFEPKSPSPHGLPLQSLDATPESQPSEAIPATALAYLEHRPGFVNFHYNRQQLGRIATLLQDRVSENWPQKLVWEGEDRDRGQLRLAVSLENAGFTSSLETRVDRWPSETESATSAEREGRENNQATDASKWYSDRHLMLYGLMAWQRLQVSGLQSFLVAHYQGKYPSRRSDELLDVVEVSFADLNVEFFIDEEGRVRNLICSQLGQVSGSEIYFENWSDQSDTVIAPLQFSVDHHGENFFHFDAKKVRGDKDDQ